MGKSFQFHASFLSALALVLAAESQAGYWDEVKDFPGALQEWGKGLEKSCPDGNEGSMAGLGGEKLVVKEQRGKECVVRTLGLSVPTPMGLGDDSRQKRLQVVEDWIWIDEAMRIRARALRENKFEVNRALEYLKTPANSKNKDKYKASFDKIAEHVRLLGKIRKDAKKLDSRMANLRTGCKPFFAKECRDGYSEELKQIRDQRLALHLAEEEILRDTPIVAHSTFEQWIEKEKDPEVDWGGREKFNKDLIEALEEADEAIDTRIGQFDKIRLEEGKLGAELAKSWGGNYGKAQEAYKDHVNEVINDPALLQELVLTTNPTEKKEFQKLQNAHCRLFKRSYSKQAGKVLKEFGIQAALAIPSVLVASPIMAGKALSSLSMAGRLTALGAAEAGFHGLNAKMISDTKKRCQRINTALFSGASHGSSAENIGQEYQVCQDELHGHYLGVLLTVAGTGITAKLAAKGVREGVKAAATTGDDVAKAAVAARAEGAGAEGVGVASSSSKIDDGAGGTARSLSDDFETPAPSEGPRQGPVPAGARISHMGEVDALLKRLPRKDVQRIKTQYKDVLDEVTKAAPGEEDTAVALIHLMEREEKLAPKVVAANIRGILCECAGGKGCKVR